MTEKKRFTVETDEGFELSIKDNVGDNYLFSICCESIDYYETILTK